MAPESLEIRVASSADELDLVLLIDNRSPEPVTVFEPHPHTSVQLVDASGKPWPGWMGVFAANPRWQVTVAPGEVCRQTVVLVPFFIAARGDFVAECDIRCRVGDRDERMLVRGAVRLALPTIPEFYAARGIDARKQTSDQ
jgi:hypothetical protein